MLDPGGDTNYRVKHIVGNTIFLFLVFQKLIDCLIIEV